jgi:hypothetical protein
MGDKALVDFSRYSHLTSTPMTLEVVLSSLDKTFPYPPSPFLEDEREPLQLIWLLLIGAVLGSLLVFTGFQVADSHAPAASNQISVASGAQTMSATELIQYIKARKHSVYWLNLKQGDSYSDNSSINGIDKISYHPEGSTIADLNQFDVVIGTYRDISTYNAQPHPFLGADGRTFTLSNGATLTYNQLSSNLALVAFPDRPEIVVLNYPATQAVPTLINDAQNLVPIA